jgi:hypothetical protein
MKSKSRWPSWTDGAGNGSSAAVDDPSAMLANTAAPTAENCQIAFIILLCRRESGHSK